MKKIPKCEKLFILKMLSDLNNSRRHPPRQYKIKSKEV
jgi:hypothetical protein